MSGGRGPNVSVEDFVRSVREDPMFNSWRDPVPPEWFNANKGAYSIVDQDALYGSLVFSRYLGRSVSETVTTPSDSATRSIVYLRGQTELLDTPIESTSVSQPPPSALGSSAIGTDPIG